MEFESVLPNWVVWEAMGRKVVVGYAVEGEVAGQRVVQIGIPGQERGTFPVRPNLSPSSLYCVTIINEERARQMCGLDRPRQLPAGAVGTDVPTDDEYDPERETRDDDDEVKW